MPTSPSSWRRWRSRLAWFALLPAAGWAAASAALWFGQERLLFHPVPLPPDTVLATAPDVQERVVEVPGARLSVLELRHPEPRGVVFFLHGNGGNLREWFVNLDVYRRTQVDLVMFDYRGYGKSSGRIESEAQLHSDVRAAWQSIAPLYQGKRRVVHGRSLGTALAAQLSVAIKPELTVLVSPYKSLEALVGELYPWVPSFALRYPLHTDRAIMQMRTPLLIVHGERDTFITPEHARMLASLVPDTQLVLVPAAGHGNIVATAGYRNALRVQLDAQ